MHTQLIILAAGMGSRFGGLKQLEPIGPLGETIIDYSLFDAQRAGFNDIIFIIRKDFSHEFRQTIGKKWENTVEVHYVNQDMSDTPIRLLNSTRKKPWGTGHALYTARKITTAPFGIINGDDFYGYEAFKKLHNELIIMNTRNNYCLITYLLEKTLSCHGTVSRGICQITPDNNLVAIEEHIDIQKRDGYINGYNTQTKQNVRLAENAITSMNMFGFTPAIFADLEPQLAEFLKDHHTNEHAEFFLPSIVNRLIYEKKARISTCPTNSEWMGITYKEDRSHLGQKILDLVHEHHYPEKLISDHV